MNPDILILQGNAEMAASIHYEVDPAENPIGIGGSGTVRRGICVNEKNGTKREVAIKFLFDDLNESAIDRSRREASIRILNENLVEMLGFVQVSDTDMYGRGSVHYHVVSEYLHGVMLLDLLNGVTKSKEGIEYPAVMEYAELLKNDRTKFAVKIIRSVLSGVLALHDNGYIHRDINPSNIMITNDGKVKLIDLGIAKRLSNLSTQDGHTMMGQFIGKAFYAAPEQVRGDVKSQDQTTDIYSIGIMLYQLVTGVLPFTGTTEEILDKHLNSRIPSSNIKDKKIRQLIKKATEKKQKDRFQSAAEFRAALDSIGNSSTKSKAAINMTSKRWMEFVAVSIVGIILGVILALFI